MPKKKYVVWCIQENQGDFEFNPTSQDNFFSSPEEARAFIEETCDDGGGIYDVLPTSAFVIYEISLTKVKA